MHFLKKSGTVLENAKLYSKYLDNWKISWESEGQYRHWCLQQYICHTSIILVVMFNPGSLSRDGRDLKKDTTLRILREVFEESQFSPLIVNLYDYSTSSPAVFFSHWNKRDSTTSIYSRLDYSKIKGVLSDYGDYQFKSIKGLDIEERIGFVKKHLENIPEVVSPKNKTQSPKHPLSWQREKLKLKVRESICNFLRE